MLETAKNFHRSRLYFFGEVNEELGRGEGGGGGGHALP